MINPTTIIYEKLSTKTVENPVKNLINNFGDINTDKNGSQKNVDMNIDIKEFYRSFQRF